jgi:LysR family transcriptional regulator, hydrogen peroxide-inducible genes activator
MELHQLRYFVAAAEAGTISRAAQRCSIAQPSLSQQLKKLEESLGAQLLDRLGRGIALTEAGRALLPRARRILAEVRDAEANLEREVREGIGGVSIGAIPTMAPYLLPPAIQRLRGELPACEVTIREARTEELIELLVENQIDCALMSTPVPH